MFENLYKFRFNENCAKIVPLKMDNRTNVIPKNS